MDAKDFGQRVYRFRMEKGWSQELCSARAGISIRTLQMIESYSVMPTIETAGKLAVAFSCAWEDLLGPPSSVAFVPMAIAAAPMPPLPKKK